MTTKKVKLEEQYPEVYAFAQSVVAKVKRSTLKKQSVSKTASELIQPLLDFKSK